MNEKADKILRVLDIPIELTVVLGRCKMSIKDVLEIGRGTVIELDTFVDEEVEILANGKVIAYGQIVVVGQNFGIKINNILDGDNLERRLL